MAVITMEEKLKGEKKRGEESLAHKLQLSFLLMSILPIMMATYLVVTYVFPYARDLTQVSLLSMLMLFVAVLGFLVLYQLTKGISRMAINAKAVVEGNLSQRLQADSGGQEINELARSFNRITAQLEDKVVRLEEAHKDTRRILGKIAEVLTTAEDMKRLMNIVISTTTQALHAERGLLLILSDNEPHSFKAVASFGWPEEEASTFSIKKGEGLLGRVAESGQGFIYSSYETQKPPASLTSLERGSDAIVAAPLMTADRILGVISMHNKLTGEKFLEDDLILLKSLAAQLSVVWQNHQLQADIDKAYLDTIAALAMAVESRDKYTRGHTERVKEYSVKIGKAMGLSPKEQEMLSNGALLHDLGKIGVADAYLHSEGNLTSEEWASMKQHPIIGENIVKPVVSLRGLCPIIRHHHEKYNGEGYPDGLKGEEIPLLARILAVADAFDAMTTNRPYRKALSFEEAKEELQRLKGNQFDPKVVGHLFTLMDSLTPSS